MEDGYTPNSHYLTYAFLSVKRLGELIILNPFTPKGDQLQISPAALPEMLHIAVWNTWLFIAYSDANQIPRTETALRGISYCAVDTIPKYHSRLKNRTPSFYENVSNDLYVDASGKLHDGSYGFHGWRYPVTWGIYRLFIRKITVKSWRVVGLVLMDSTARCNRHFAIRRAFHLKDLQQDPVQRWGVIPLVVKDSSRYFASDE